MCRFWLYHNLTLMQMRAAGAASLAFIGATRYESFSRKLTWDVAENICNRQGGHLASIASAAEDAALAQQLTSAEAASLYR